MTGVVLIPQISLLLSGLIASFTDVTRRRIPNWLSLLTLLGGLAFAWWDGGLVTAGNHALHMGIALVVGMGLFAVRAIGGGDAKFYAAVAAWFALNQGLRLFVYVSFSGLLLLVIWFSVRRIQGKPIRRKGGGVEGLPYGVAIAVGALLLATMGGAHEAHMPAFLMEH